MFKRELHDLKSVEKIVIARFDKLKRMNIKSPMLRICSIRFIDIDFFPYFSRLILLELNST